MLREFGARWRRSFEVAKHMTDSEKEQLNKLSAQYGVWVARSFAIPFGLVFGLALLPYLLEHLDLPPLPLELGWIPAIGIMLVCLVVHIAGAIPRKRRQRELLAGTEYARSKGYTPADVW